jgi:hypothetical protein
VVGETCSRLNRVGAKVLGVVLNYVDGKRSGYYYGSASYSCPSEPLDGAHDSRGNHANGINHSNRAKDSLETD